VNFAQPVARYEGVQRDQYDRPLIIQPGGGVIPYGRISGLGKLLDDETNLIAWKQRMTAIGVARRPYLVAVAATADRDDKKTLDAVVTAAMAAAESDAASNIGSAFHRITDVAERGGDLGYVPDHFRPGLASFEAATAHLKVIAMERFVVCDELQVAGSFDRLYLTADGKFRIGDTKAGAWAARFPHAIAVQLACYAHGDLYDTVTGERTPLSAIVDKQIGILMHVPAKTGVCTVYDVDLAAGWGAAKLAVQVREWRRAKSLIRPTRGA